MLFQYVVHCYVTPVCVRFIIIHHHRRHNHNQHLNKGHRCCLLLQLSQLVCLSTLSLLYIIGAKKKYFNLNPTSTHSPTPTHWLTLKHTTHQQTKNSPANPDQHFGDNFGGFPYNSFVDQFVPLKISAVTGLYSSKRKNNKRKINSFKVCLDWQLKVNYLPKKKIKKTMKTINLCRNNLITLKERFFFCQQPKSKPEIVFFDKSD